MKRTESAGRRLTWERRRAATAAVVGLLAPAICGATSAPGTMASVNANRTALFDVVMVSDVNTGSVGSQPRLLSAAQGSLYFAAETPDRGREPWVTDGTSDTTRLVGDIVPGPQSSFLRNVAATAEHTILALDNSPAVPDGPLTGTLWATTTTGSSEGTTTLLMSGSLAATDAVSFGDVALLGLSDFMETVQLWRTDGTPEGTRLVKDALGMVTNLTPAGDRAFFTDGQKSLLLTDGTTRGTRRLFTWGLGPYGDILVGDVAGAGDKAFLDVSATFAEGAEMWVSDGTRKGTRVLKDINPGPAGARPAQLTPVKRHMFFTAEDGQHDREVWRSRGTTASTRRVTDLGQSGVGNLTACRGALYFTTTYENSAALWRTHGRPGHYPRVTSLPGKVGAAPTMLTCMSGGLAFVADDGVHGRELWTLADGARRAVLHDLRAGARSSRPSELTRVGSRLFLAADDGSHGRELWVVAPAAAILTEH